MKLICAGVGKTGTKSIAHALRLIGYKVYDFDDQVYHYMDQWCDLYGQGKKPDFYTMFKDVDAVIDFPSNFFFEELMEAFPEAKVILSVRRDEDVWSRSLKNQLEIIWGSYLTKMGCLLPTYNKLMVIFRNFVMSAFGTLDPKSTYICRKRYRWHNERVKSVVPAEKLLVFSVEQGWEPLCEFTGKKIPDQPFPHLNVKGSIFETFQTETELGRKITREMNVLLQSFAAVLVLAIALVFYYYM